jgi:ribulose-5-phosphate 4-epimerase/fuculose-1-phosphate aldolase
MDLETLKHQVSFGARSLQRKLNDIWGHVSARLPAASGQEGFVLAHLRIPFKPAPPDELYCFDYQGRLLEGKGQVPWEIPLYTNIYRARPDVGSIVHAHPPLTIALGISGETIRPVHQLSACFAAGVPTFGGELINSEELGKKVAETLGDKRAILLVGHGAVTVGADVPEAVTTALLMEETACNFWRRPPVKSRRCRRRFLIRISNQPRASSGVFWSGKRNPAPSRRRGSAVPT